MLIIMTAVTILVSSSNLSLSLMGLLNGFATTMAWQSSTTTLIRVCQNKHCSKRATKNVDVLQTVHNLLGRQQPQSNEEERCTRSNIFIEPSACLSHCDVGPNVQVQLPTGTSVLLHGMTDTEACVVQLELMVEREQQSNATTDPLQNLSPPKLLVAAAKVMELSQTLPSFEERIRYLTSVIAKFQSSSAGLQVTAANAHAHALRARSLLGQYSNTESRSDLSSLLDQVTLDAKYVVRDLASVATQSSITTAFRTWVDATHLQATNSRKDYFQNTLAILQEWCNAQPQYRVKLQNEMQQVQREIMQRGA